ncbi:hypothetical protein [Chryseobacterium sp. ERMR1:04]|uniref:hypothetical protein n=1 Tax=Chryseobacterium sp. ERMR1:04 TaxID=1705393 RepID=UPI0006C8D5BE|nr:hypothetical protein [Chryseobacterium sp. ERMR1:04]KPH13353.1 hypothetical protein AMQ68_12965 [Chryseobacterium sp. ERMR1:04]
MKPAHTKKSFLYPGKKWEKTFQIWRISIRIGLTRDFDTSSFFIEKSFKKGEHIFLRQHVFQKIYNGDKIRLAHHTRKQILKKVISGQ